MTYAERDLYGIWENLDDDSLLMLEGDGDFKLTPAGDDLVEVNRWINVVGGTSGKWTIEDGKLKLSVDFRSLKLSSPYRFIAIGFAMLSFLLRFLKDSEIVCDEITHLTGADLWIENPQGKVTKFKKK